MRALGIDLGAKRVGVAVSDSGGTVATPVDTIRRDSDRLDHLAAAIQAAVDDWQAEVVVVGMPYSLSGDHGPAVEATEAVVRSLRDTLTVPVVSYDERLTTVTAERSLMTQGLSGRARREKVDQVAASVILQAWLDAGCPHGP